LPEVEKLRRSSVEVHHSPQLVVPKELSVVRMLFLQQQPAIFEHLPKKALETKEKKVEKEGETSRERGRDK
jgi:hypothetical protein